MFSSFKTNSNNIWTSVKILSILKSYIILNFGSSQWTTSTSFSPLWRIAQERTIELLLTITNDSIITNGILMCLLRKNIDFWWIQYEKWVQNFNTIFILSKNEKPCYVAQVLHLPLIELQCFFLVTVSRLNMNLGLLMKRVEVMVSFL